MSDKLSQEEIAALIAGITAGEDGAGADGDVPGGRLHVVSDKLASAFAAGATRLQALLGRPLTLAAPVFRQVPATEAAASLGAGYVLARADFTSGLSGSVMLCLAEADAARLGALAMGEEWEGTEPAFTEAHAGALGEAVNQLLGAVATEMAADLGGDVAFGPPEVLAADAAAEAIGGGLPAEAEVLFGDLTLQLEGFPPLPVQIILPPTLVEALSPALPPAKGARRGGAAPVGLTAAERGADPAAAAAAAAATVVEMRAGTAAAQPAARLAQPAAAAGAAAGRGPVGYRSAAFREIAGAPPPAESQNIELLLDVPLQITVELGRTRRQIREVLAMGPGSVVELDRLAGEAVDVLVNGKLVAKGEVVVIDENFGVRITDIVSPAERIRNL